MAREDDLIYATGKIAINGDVIDNPTTFAIEISRADISLKNFGSNDRGNYYKLSPIESISFSATVHSYSGEKLKYALAGDLSNKAAQTISDYALTAVDGGLAAVSNIIDKSSTVTVTHNAGSWAATTAYSVDDWIYDGTHLYKAIVAGTSGATSPAFPTDGSTVVDGTVTWQDMGAFSAVRDTDFEVWSSGIYIISGQGIPDGAPIKVAFDSYPHQRIDIGTSPANEVRIDFDGLNDILDPDSGVAEPIIGFFRKCNISPASLALIGDEIGSWTLTAEVLPDSSAPINESKYGALLKGKQSII